MSEDELSLFSRKVSPINFMEENCLLFKWEYAPLCMGMCPSLYGDCVPICIEMWPSLYGNVSLFVWECAHVGMGESQRISGSSSVPRRTPALRRLVSAREDVRGHDVVGKWGHVGVAEGTWGSYQPFRPIEGSSQGPSVTLSYRFQLTCSNNCKF